jgi:hypothetical protein
MDFFTAWVSEHFFIALRTLFALPFGVKFIISLNNVKNLLQQHIKFTFNCRNMDVEIAGHF